MKTCYTHVVSMILLSKTMSTNVKCQSAAVLQLYNTFYVIYGLFNDAVNPSDFVYSVKLYMITE
jgi:hypothetical protein